MKYSLIKTVPQELIRKHAVASVWISPALLIFCYAAITSMAYVQSRYGNVATFILFMIPTSGLQHHLITLMHEAAHNHLAKNKTANEFLGQAFCAFPFAMMLKDYKLFHTLHHKYSGDPELDPEVGFYRATGIGYGAKSKTLKESLLNDLSGKSTIESIKYMQEFTKTNIAAGKLRPTSLKDVAFGLIGLACMLAVPFILNFVGTYLLLWVLTSVLITPYLVRYHSIGEHTGVNTELEQDKTLTHEFNPITNFFLYPINSAFHLEHHLFAQIPWYKMKAFRKDLMELEIYKSESKKLTVDGYWFGNKTVEQLVHLDHQEA